MFLKPFKGKHILITGGASGLGLALAKAYAREGAHIAIVDADKAALSDAQREVEQAGAGTRCLVYACNLGEGQILRDYINMIHYEFGALNGLVICPSPLPTGALSEFNHSEIDLHIDSHVKGALHALRAALPYIGEHEHIGGVVGVVAPFGREISISAAISQGALSTMTQCLRAEHKKQRIRIHLLLPPVDVPRHKYGIISRRFLKGIAKHRKVISYGYTTRPRRFMLRHFPLIWKLFFGRKHVRKVVAPVEQPRVQEAEVSTPKVQETAKVHPKAAPQPTASAHPKASPQPTAQATPKQARPAQKPKVQPATQPSAQHPTPQAAAPRPTAKKGAPPKRTVSTATPNNGFTVYNDTLLKGIIISMEIEDVRPFLKTIVKYISSFEVHITDIVTGIANLNLDETESWEFEVEYDGRVIPFQIDITMNANDVITMHFYTTPKLALIIDQEFGRSLSA